MKIILKLILGILLFTSCSNNSLNLVFLEKQIDRDIKQTEEYIRKDISYLQKATSTEEGKGLRSLVDKYSESSMKTSYQTSQLLSSKKNLNTNIDSIRKTYINHLELLISFVKNDGIQENDYLLESFNTILGKDSLTKHNYIDSIVNTKSESLARIQLKLTYSQLKKAEHKIWTYFRRAIKGYGLTMNFHEVIIQVQNTLLSDSISGKIFCDSYGKLLITKYHFGKIDSTAFYNERNHLYYPIGKQVKIPLIGEYKTLPRRDDKSFEIAKKYLVKNKLEGVMEIKSTDGTFFYIFKKDILIEPAIN